MVFQLRRNGHLLTTCVDREIFRTPRFAELKAAISQVTLLGEAPYRVITDEDGTTVELPTMTALVEHVLQVGRKGVTVQRYKGLGEMNPEQLWQTTMNPEKRTLLQVRVEDAVEADEIFTTLMGDQVEPRKDFIFKNALYVSNLDV
jgi:DNA gyrase subunit B